MLEDFARYAIEKGGSIHPLIVPAEHTNGLGLMNPSIINDNGVIRVIIRQVNYTLFHSEKKTFNHQYGPLQYIHPENDMHLRTWNWYAELDDDLNVTKCVRIDTSKFDTYDPQWDFVGLEDARIVRWDGDLWISGVRRDTTTNGQGRMELSKIEVQENKVVETDRYRIEPPVDKNSYCEKNWMPILDKPWQYVKWGNPTELVEVDINNVIRTDEYSKWVDSKQLIHKDYIPLPHDLRGGSQVIQMGEFKVALTHEVNLFDSEVGRKDGKYYHRFIFWDKDYKITHYSDMFWILGGHIEFSTGMCVKDKDLLITFGFQDNAAYVLRVPIQVMVDFVNAK